MRDKYVDREKDYSKQHFLNFLIRQDDCTRSSLESHCYSPRIPRQRLRVTAASIRAREDRRRRCQDLARGNPVSHLFRPLIPFSSFITSWELKPFPPPKTRLLTPKPIGKTNTDSEPIQTRAISLRQIWLEGGRRDQFRSQQVWLW